MTILFAKAALLFLLTITVVIKSTKDISEITSSFFFYESFDSPNEDFFEDSTWTKSVHEKYKTQALLVKPPNNPIESFEKDHGLHLSQENKHYGVSTKFKKPLQSNGKDVVIQYELKLEETLNCGGAYIKLLRENEEDLKDLNGNTPYTIMFGPDKCGSNNKVHFILQHQNPISKIWEEKHFNDTPAIRTDRKTHLYTLKLSAEDNNFEIYIDKKVVKHGNLLTHMNPPINPPSEIDDPTDSKPVDWVDDATIDDPTASKPDDWDDNAPLMIPDPNAKKPDGWLDDAPDDIPDPSAIKPEDWDDEEDGTWEPPLVSNPACEKIGCGEWKVPTIKNPSYKGKWKAPKIPNPLYKGEWKAKQIPNPDFFVDEKPIQNMAPMTALAIEVWTTNAGLHFDNFAIADSIEKAFELADATHTKKITIENENESKQNKDKMKKARDEKLAKGNLRDTLEAYLGMFIEWVQDNVIAFIASIVVSISSLAFIYNRIFHSSKATNASLVGSNDDNADVSKEDDDDKNEKKGDEIPSPKLSLRRTRAENKESN